MEPLDTKAANKAALGAPGTIRIGDRVCIVSQPTKADFGTLNKFLSQLWKSRNSSPLTAVAKELRDMPPELRELVQPQAVSRAVDRGNGNASPEPGDLAQLLLDPEAAAFWVWHLCRKNEPDLTLAQVQAVAGDKANPEAAADMLADMLEATSMRNIAPNSNGGPGSSS